MDKNNIIEKPDHLWTKTLHSMTIGGNAGGIIMLGSFFSKYPDPLVALGKFWILMSIYVAGLVFGGFAATVGMNAERKNWRAVIRRKLVTEEARDLFDMATQIVLIREANETFDSHQNTLSQDYLIMNWFIAISGGAFVVGSIFMVLVATNIPT